MSTATTVPVDSKSAKKRKAKGENPTTGSGVATPSVEATTSELPATTNGVDSHAESPYIKEISR